MAVDSKVAAGVKVFSRVEKLGRLLDSMTETGIDTVYVADDGEPSDAKADLYGAEYPFELEVLDLEYDAGLGYGRNQIVEACESEYLLVVDSDHTVPPDVTTLAEQLEADPVLGGVAGLLHEHGKIAGTVHDLYERGNGEVLVRDVRDNKHVELVVGRPFVEFDFVPNACMFRTAALEEQPWDPAYVIGKEHLDFYLAHRETEWRFGVDPTTLFGHDPGGDTDYSLSRESAEKLDASREYFLQKWGYRQVLLGQTDWVDGTRPTLESRVLLEGVAKRLLLSLPVELQVRLMDVRNQVRRARGQPPL